MSRGIREVRTLAACAGLALLAAAATVIPNTARAATPPPAMTFTPDVRADTSEGTALNQNEPSMWVDQSGLTYVTWQGATRPGGGSTNTISTLDGVNFTQLGSTDAGGSQGGDVALATTSWPNANVDTPVGPQGENGVFWGDLGSNTCGPLGFRASVSDNQGVSFTHNQDAGCQAAQIDRDWVAAYTPPLYRGTTQALSHTLVYDAYHDFGPSNVWVSRSTNGGVTWTTVQQSAIQPGSTGQVGSLCNTYPGGVAVDQNGAHQGRVYVVWNTGDTGQNTTNGCNVTSGQPFDHIFLSYSDDGGSNWTTHAVFNDPCAPNPPAPPVMPTTCQDTSEGWTPVSVDDAGNVYVAFTWIDISKPNPRYDVYLEVSKDGGTTWDGGTIGAALGLADHPGPPIDVTSAMPGTSYYPEMGAGGTGGVDIAWYNTPYTTVPGTLQKPAAQPESAVWDVYVGQSLDANAASPSWTISKVSTHSNYFGDICTIGIACGSAVPGTNWGPDRVLLDNFALAVGPDGGARIAWTDARDSWTSATTPPCQPGPQSDTTDDNVLCQQTHVYFACQTSGLGVAGQTITGCAQAQPAASTPEAPWIPGLVLGAGAAALLVRRVQMRRRIPAIE
jgi:hypothetical protein